MQIEQNDSLYCSPARKLSSSLCRSLIVCIKQSDNAIKNLPLWVVMGKRKFTAQAPEGRTFVFLVVKMESLIARNNSIDSFRNWSCDGDVRIFQVCLLCCSDATDRFWLCWALLCLVAISVLCGEEGRLGFGVPLECDAAMGKALPGLASKRARGWGCCSAVLYPRRQSQQELGRWDTPEIFEIYWVVWS